MSRPRPCRDNAMTTSRLCDRAVRACPPPSKSSEAKPFTRERWRFEPAFRIPPIELPDRSACEERPAPRCQAARLFRTSSDCNQRTPNPA
jgi:hypothetical protein